MKSRALQFILRFTSSILLFFVLGAAAEAYSQSVNLTASPTSRTVYASKKTTYTISINRINFADKVTLAVISGLPANSTATFSPNTTTATSSTLTVQTQSNTPAGNYVLTIKGTAAGIVIPSVSVQLQVTPMPSMTLSLAPANQSIIAGQTAGTDLTFVRTNFTGNVTLSAVNPPGGVSVQFSPSVTSGNTSRMQVTTTGLPFTTANYDLTIRAQATNGVYATAVFQLRVNPGISFADQFGTPTNQTLRPDFATDVTYDAAGNVYVTGYAISNTATGATEPWVAKYNTAGTRQWLQTIGGLTRPQPTDVFVDSAGQVYVAGTTLVPGTSNLDIFAAKFNANGVAVGGVRTFGSTHEDGSGGMVFGVSAGGSVTLTAPTHIVRTVPQRDWVGTEYFQTEYSVTRYTFDSNFNPSAAFIVNLGIGNPKDIAVGSDGSVFVLTDDRSQFNPIQNLGIINTRVQKFLSPLNQNYISSAFGSAAHNLGTLLKSDSNGNVFLIGHEYEPNSALTNPPRSAWIAKINNVGNTLWNVGLTSYFPTEIKSLDTDSAGDIYVAGNTWDSLAEENPNPGGPSVGTARTDAWFAKYSGSTGGQLFVSQFNVSDKDGFNAIRAGATVSGTTPLYFAGYTVAFKSVNYGFEDPLLIRCSSSNCGVQ